MEFNIAEQQHFSNDSLSEPHFDQEATVAAARPVVPIQEIKAEKLSRSRLAFGLTILASVVIGALGATLIYKQRNRQPASAIVETAVTGVGANSQDAAIETQAAEIQTENVPQDADVSADVESETSPAAQKPNAVKIKRQTVSVPQVDETETLRSERIEARRLRRRAEREAEREARRDRKRGDDLLRIREIFEGTRRP